jgi:phage terminase large subunit-like protein
MPTATAMPWGAWPKMKASAHFIRFAETFMLVTEGTLIGQPVVIHPFQRRIIRDLLDHDPRPTQAVVSMPRGNGKTALIAMLAVWHAFTVKGGRVIIVATKEEQALIAYRQAKDIIEASPVLAAQTTEFAVSRAQRMHMASSGGEIQALPSTVRGLQGRRPSLALIDEVGFVDDGVWSALALGLGKHKDSQLVGWGTPGFDRGQMWRLRTAALSPDPPRGLLYHEIAAPPGSEKEPYDPRTIRAANPAVAAGFLDIEAIKANALTETKADYLTFRLGIWASREEQWVRAEDWDLLAVDDELPGEGASVALGFDGSVGGPKRDTTALVAARGQNIWVVGYWEAPEGASKDWRVPRAEVVAVIDRAMTRWNATLYADPWHWRAELEALTERYPDRVLEVNTGARARFGPMVDRFATSVRLGALVHDGNEHLRDHVLGAVAEPHAQGTLIRKDMRLIHRPHIDLAVAAAIAHHHAAQEPELPAVW